MAEDKSANAYEEETEEVLGKSKVYLKMEMTEYGTCV